MLSMVLRLFNQDFANWKESKISGVSVEGGQTDKILNQMEEGSASMQQFFSSSMSRVTSGVQGISSGMNAQVSR